MLRARSSRIGSAAKWVAATLCTVVLFHTPAFGQASTTATIRGAIQDSSGGVLPGATVTVTNTATRAVQTTVSDDRGQYLFAALFPGTYDLRVELSGFKSYERKNIALSPNDTRGLAANQRDARPDSPSLDCGAPARAWPKAVEQQPCIHPGAAQQEVVHG